MLRSQPGRANIGLEVPARSRLQQEDAMTATPAALTPDELAAQLDLEQLSNWSAW